MIEINHTLLSSEALNNLIIDPITQQSTDYMDTDLPIENRKNEIIKKLDNGEAVIVYSSKEETCHILSNHEFNKLPRQDCNRV